MKVLKIIIFDNGIILKDGKFPPKVYQMENKEREGDMMKEIHYAITGDMDTKLVLYYGEDDGPTV